VPIHPVERTLPADPEQPYRPARQGARPRHGLQAGAWVSSGARIRDRGPRVAGDGRHQCRSTTRPILPRFRSGSATPTSPPPASTIAARRGPRTARLSRSHIEQRTPGKVRAMEQVGVDLETDAAPNRPRADAGATGRNPRLTPTIRFQPGCETSYSCRRRNRTPLPPPELAAPSLMNSTPAASSAAITLVKLSITPRTVPLLASMR
jgi:hypothetical protein